MKLPTVILDLLRTYSGKGASVSTLIEAGKLFNFNENMIRVCLSRLVTSSKIENFKRGFYRLAQETDPLNKLIEEWRLGESRRSFWDSRSWLFVYLNPSANTKNQWALSCLGFRSIGNGDLWLRPSNLSKPIEGIQILLHQIGLDCQYSVIQGASASGAIERQWLMSIELNEFENSYRLMRVKLESSLLQLPLLMRHDAMRQSFHLGGEAINMIAKDLLLPEQIQDPKERIRLWETLVIYDEAGRDIWADRDSAPWVTTSAQAAVMQT